MYGLNAKVRGPVNLHTNNSPQGQKGEIMWIDTDQGTTDEGIKYGYIGDDDNDQDDSGGFFFTHHDTLDECLKSIEEDDVDPPQRVTRDEAEEAVRKWFGDRKFRQAD